MQLKYVGPVLVVVAAAGAGLFFALNQKPPPVAGVAQQAPVAPSQNSPSSLAPVLASLEQRLASLSERIGRLESRGEGVNDLAPAIEDLGRRLEGLEVHLRQQQPTFAEEARDEDVGYHTLVSPNRPDARLTEVQLAFENDTSAAAARQVELENVEAIFDHKELEGLEFRQIDCREHYCRLVYDDLSTDRSASLIAENELILLLAQKYGGGITIHGGERIGTSKSVYIELGAN